MRSSTGACRSRTRSKRRDRRRFALAESPAAAGAAAAAADAATVASGSSGGTSLWSAEVADSAVPSRSASGRRSRRLKVVRICQ